MAASLPSIAVPARLTYPLKTQAAPYDGAKWNDSEANSIKTAVNNHAEWLIGLLAQQSPPAVVAFNPQSSAGYFGPNAQGLGASLVTYVQGGVTDFYNAKRRLTLADFPAGIPAPTTGLADDPNWQLASPPAAEFQIFQALSVGQARQLVSSASVKENRLYRLARYDAPEGGGGGGISQAPPRAEFDVLVQGLTPAAYSPDAYAVDNTTGSLTQGTYALATDGFTPGSGGGAAYPADALTQAQVDGLALVRPGLSRPAQLLDTVTQAVYVTPTGGGFLSYTPERNIAVGYVVARNVTGAVLVSRNGTTLYNADPALAAPTAFRLEAGLNYLVSFTKTVESAEASVTFAPGGTAAGGGVTPAPDSITEPMLAQAVRTKLNATGSGGGGGIDFANPITLTAAATLQITKAYYVTGGGYALTLPPVAGNLGAVIFLSIATAATGLYPVGGTPYSLYAAENINLRCTMDGWRKTAGELIPMSAELTNGGTSQALVNNSVVNLQFAAVNSDNTGGLLIQPANNRLVIQRAGKGTVSVQLFASGGIPDGTNAEINIYVGGNQYRCFAVVQQGAALGVFTRPVDVTAGQFIRAAIYSYAVGGNATLGSTIPGQCFLSFTETL